MALDISMTGTGTLGQIAPGWSLSESVSPIAIGDPRGGTGALSFTAQSTDESLLVINNNITSYVNDLGYITGVVQSVSQTGLSTSVTHGTQLDKFNLDCQVEPVEFGGPSGWIYNMYCAIGIQERDNYLPAIASTGASFPMHFSSMSSDYLYTFRSFLPNSAISVDPSAAVSNYILFQSESPTAGWEDGDGLTDGFLPFMVGAQTGVAGSVTPTNSMVLQILTVINNSTGSRIYLGNQFGSTTPSTIAYANCFTIDIDSTTLLVTITELGTSTSVSYDFSTLAYLGGNPLLFTFQTGVNAAGQMTVKVYVKDIFDNGGSSATLVINNSGGTNWGIRYDSFNGVLGTINAFTTSVTGDLSAYIDYFEAIIGGAWASNTSISYQEDYHYAGAYPATSGIALELMQQLASAENIQVTTQSDVIRFDDLSTVPGDNFLANVVGPPTINPQSTLSGRQINIAYNNAEYVLGSIYDAEDDGNNIITVNAGGSTVTSVKFNVHPISVQNPVLVDGTTWPLEPGQYAVMDDTGYYLNAGEWTAYGGSVTAEIDPTDNSAIRITVTGPYTATTLAGNTYKLAVSDGVNEYAALNITGTGVYAGDNQLKLITGIDPDKYTRATIATINNPFVITEENAYDRGLWAAQRASGPVVSLNATVPTSSTITIGSTCGLFINYLDSAYRIISASVGNISTSIDAERYVTVANVDAIWGTQTVADYDALWGNYECQDQIIFPFKVA